MHVLCLLMHVILALRYQLMYFTLDLLYSTTTVVYNVEDMKKMIIYAYTPGTGGGGGDLEPSSMGRFCWYLSQFGNIPMQQKTAGRMSSMVCCRYVAQSCGVTLSTVPPHSESVQRLPLL